MSIERFKRFHGNGKSRIGAINTGAINSQFINLSLDFLKFSTGRSDKDGPPGFWSPSAPLSPPLDKSSGHLIL